jgi:hypothetical protein
MPTPSQFLKFRPFLLLFTLLMLLSSAALTTAAETESPVTVTCPFNNDVGDQLGRGFYYTGFSGNRLNTVTLNYFPSEAGIYTTRLTVRLGTYDGPVVGSRAITTDLAATFQQVVYDFGSVTIPVGSTLTFSQTIDSGVSSVVFYDTGIEPCAGFTQTEDTSFPLSSFRRPSAGAIITGSLVETTVDGESGPGASCGNLSDGRLNNDPARDCAAPIAVYVEAGTVKIYGIDPDNGGGVLAVALSADELHAFSASGVNQLLAEVNHPSTGRSIQVWWLASGEIQIITSYADGKAYSIAWPLDSIVDWYHISW